MTASSSPLENSYPDFEALKKAHEHIDLGSLPDVEVNPFSSRALDIVLTASDHKVILAKATGFLYRHRGAYWLITNHHNFTGVNMVTKKRIDNFGSSPLKCIVPINCNTKIPGWEEAIFDLYSGSAPRWLIHPRQGVDVDVAVLGLRMNTERHAPKAINDPGKLTARRKPRVPDDVFVVGYPEIWKGAKKEKHFPIWKRASIAFEPDIDSGGLPRTYIDTASRSGMSGSPVLFRCQETINNQGLWDYSLYGVYSGRLGSGSELDSQLGVVWKAKVIEEIIDGGRRDNVYYPEENFPSD